MVSRGRGRTGISVERGSLSAERSRVAGRSVYFV